MGKFFTKARKTYNKITKSDIVKKAKKGAKAAVLAVKNTCQKVKQKTKEVYNQAKQKTKEVYNQTKKKIKTTVKKSKQLMKEKVLSTKATRKTTGKSRVKAKDWTGHKNRINSEDELKALLDERRKTRVIGSDGEPIMTLMDKRKVVSAESTATPDGLSPYAVMGYSMFIEDYVTLTDAEASIGDQVGAASSLINPFKKFKKGKEALDSLKYGEKGIEEAYDIANKNKKAKDGQYTQKEIDQLGEYAKKVDKGTGEIGTSIPSRLKSTPELENHIKYRELIDSNGKPHPNKKGIVGAHNSNEFF